MVLIHLLWGTSALPIFLLPARNRAMKMLACADVISRGNWLRCSARCRAFTSCTCPRRAPSGPKSRRPAWRAHRLPNPAQGRTRARSRTRAGRRSAPEPARCREAAAPSGRAPAGTGTCKYIWNGAFTPWLSFGTPGQDPEHSRCGDRINGPSFPTGDFVSEAMVVAVMSSAQRHGELIALLASHRAELSEPQVVDVSSRSVWRSGTATHTQ
jgi:hypothetical protein